MEQHVMPVEQEPIPEPPQPVSHNIYNSAVEIAYSPEGALGEGIKMVKTIKACLKTLKLGSKLRQDVWMREIESLQSQGAPTTLIAVCGATGAGKSSILNAILDDNIVPTSGMRACTAVVTEIAYHNKVTIDADVSFLSEVEWKAELGVLLHDLVDEDGVIKRSTDMKSDAGIAWHKVHAVYPSISQEKLVTMTADQIIAHDLKIARILGATKNIVAPNSKKFAQEIAKYIDSKDQKRGNKKDKSAKSAGKTDPDTPALWPLIRVADANAARNNIAKDYMKKCNCIWILAPITRAVDDKTARDLLGDAFKMQLMSDYDDHAITFIASKCDDISCSEVIRALHLDGDPELEEIEERIDTNEEESREWRQRKSQAEDLLKGTEDELEITQEYLQEYEEHLQALVNGVPFTPKLTGGAAAGNKRKNPRGGKKGKGKKRRASVSSDEDEDAYDDDDSQGSGSDKESDDDVEGVNSDSENEAEEVIEPTEVTESYLEEKIAQSEKTIKSIRERRLVYRKDKKEASDYLSTLKKNIAKAQKEKNAFCSLKRSEFSRDVLKEDFRVGLKDLDDASAEERDPTNFNPTMNLRNYDEIDLPVFTCSSRDYVRLKGQVKGDGEPSCFSNIKDTGIPDLQQWCHQLTISSRQRAARAFLSQLKTFSTSIQSYVQGIGDVTAVDRETLRQKWESGVGDDDDDEDDEAGYRMNDWDASDPPSDPFDAILGNGFGPNLISMNITRPPPKVDAYGNPIGITPILIAEFGKTVAKNVETLQKHFRDGLEEKCKIGAENAAEASLPLVEEFAASMHWCTYRATLRRHGSWRRDLNVELVTPFTRNIAHSWSKVFESDMFTPFQTAALGIINKVLKDIEESAAPGLKDHARLQADLCLEQTRVALNKTVAVVKDTMNTEQKEISRCMAPHVQAQLVPGYDRAMEERGIGSVARQKAYFHQFIKGLKDDIFEDGADVIMEKLTKTAAAIGAALNEALGQLAQQIEVSMSVLWEGARDDPAQVKARQRVVTIVTEIIRQVEFWTTAEATKREASHAVEDTLMEE
ncbi:hypothetical protein BD779DRAFT_1432811 [Infundibulicybe gibba]|nr:hypothetical protein BD779DRAFT_1432811 [Infundibulicybe gibba]